MTKRIKKFIPVIMAGVLAAVCAVCSSCETEIDEIRDTVSSPESAQLSNPNATEETVNTYRYLCESFGNVMLSCQQESTWMGSPEFEMDYLYSTTGRYPAIPLPAPQLRQNHRS